eukprot:COSAG02_NODE_10021_length_2046_cov_8.860812_3_plen_171_part_00
MQVLELRAELPLTHNVWPFQGRVSYGRLECAASLLLLATITRLDALASLRLDALASLCLDVICQCERVLDSDLIQRVTFLDLSTFPAAPSSTSPLRWSQEFACCLLPSIRPTPRGLFMWGVDHLNDLASQTFAESTPTKPPNEIRTDTRTTRRSGTATAAASPYRPRHWQ